MDGNMFTTEGKAILSLERVLTRVSVEVDCATDDDASRLFDMLRDQYEKTGGIVFKFRTPANT